MVYSVGGYRVQDYLKFGLPLSVIVFLGHYRNGSFGVAPDVSTPSKWWPNPFGTR